MSLLGEQWRWISLPVILAIHSRQISEHGGIDGIRDLGLLESALARPQNLAAYKNPTVFDLAAAYGFGLASNHPFLDGNKRTAFVTTRLFLSLHGWIVTAPPQEKIDIFLKLAAGKLSEQDLSLWLKNSGSSLP